LQLFEDDDDLDVRIEKQCSTTRIEEQCSTTRIEKQCSTTRIEEQCSTKRIEKDLSGDVDQSTTTQILKDLGGDDDDQTTTRIEEEEDLGRHTSKTLTRKRGPEITSTSTQYEGMKRGRIEDWLEDIHAQDDGGSPQSESMQSDLSSPNRIKLGFDEDYELNKLLNKTFGSLPVKDDGFRFNPWQTIPSSDDDYDDEDKVLDNTVNEMYDMLESQLC